jgi:outer membrane receptor for ferrienterochelin and colicins
MTVRTTLFAAASFFALLCGSASAQSAAEASPPAQTAGSSSSAPVQDIVVTASRLDAARASIEPDIGASTYTITKEAIQAMPGGDNGQLNQVILQSPGVSQDSFGQLHVRDDHNGVQFRLNGAILPEGISSFGQIISPRIIGSEELITGALPAQYGLRTAGIINITTKSGLFNNGGTVSLYGGSHGEYEPSVTYGGSTGNTNFFVSGSYLRDELGIESPDGTSTPDHDRTDQLQGFGYLDHTFGTKDRVSLIVGTSQERFQIPNTLGLEPQLGLTVNGQTNFPSAELSSNQRETTDYAIASWLHAEDRWSTQLSLYSRYSSLTYRPTPGFGELLYDGISQNADKQDTSFGLQAEGSYDLTDAHTLRSGVIISGDRGISRTLSYVLPTGPGGVQTSDVPLGIVDNGAHDQFEYSFYLQDEWKALTGLTINYGLRFDEVNAYVDEGQISPRVNAVWTPLKDTTIHAGYSRYFTPPPFELVGGETLSKFVNTTAAPEVTLDATPKSERADYYDVGLEQKLLNRHLTLGIDGYYRQSTHLIDEGQFGAPIIQTPFNYRTGHIKGVELSATYVQGPFSAYGNFAWERAQARDIESSQFNFSADDLAFIQSHYIFLDHDQTYTASAGAAYLFKDGWIGGTRFSGDLLFGSGLRADLTLPGGADIPNGRAVPDYTQVNLSVSHSFDVAYAGQLDVRFDVINVLDEDYEIRDGTGVGVGAPQFGPRRGFFGGITKTF